MQLWRIQQLELWFAKRIVEKLAVLGELDMLF